MRSYRLKLDRADRHLTFLQEAVKAFIESDPYTVSGEDDSLTGEYVARVRIREEPPAELSLIIGDFLHNARSSLDHLAYALALSHTPVLQNERSVQFLMCGDARTYAEQRPRHLAELSPTAETVIEQLQPYHQWKGDGPHPLLLLASLSNIDKHRLLHLTAGIVGGVKFAVKPTAGRPYKFFAARLGTFEDGTEIARIGISSKFADLNVTPKFEIAFENEGPGAGMPVLKALNGVMRHIQDIVLPGLEPLLGAAPTR